MSDELLDAAASLVEAWEPGAEWVTVVPSTSPIVIDAAERLADRLGLPFHDVLTHRGEHRPQGEMQKVTSEIIAYSREKAGEETVGEIVGAIPGLGQFI